MTMTMAKMMPSEPPMTVAELRDLLRLGRRTSGCATAVSCAELAMQTRLFALKHPRRTERLAGRQVA